LEEKTEPELKGDISQIKNPQLHSPMPKMGGREQKSKLEKFSEQCIGSSKKGGKTEAGAIHKTSQQTRGITIRAGKESKN